MIGIETIHWDLAGKERLEQVLAVIKPTRITIEFPATWSIEETESRIIHTRAKTTEAISSLVDIPELAKALLLDIFGNNGYEALTSINYARQVGAEIYTIDHPLVTGDLVGPDDIDGFKKSLQEALRMIPAIPKMDYLQFRNGAIHSFDRAYTQPEVFQEMSRYFPSTITLPAETWFLNSTRENEREEFMETEIRRRNPDLHIGGVAHFFEGYFEGSEVIPLYVRLSDIITRKIRLCEVESTNFQ